VPVPTLSRLLPLALSLTACGTTPTASPTTTAPTAATTEDGIRAAAAARMAEALGCRGLKPGNVEIVRTATKGDDVVAETLVSGCGELKRYTIVCRGGSCGAAGGESGNGGEAGQGGDSGESADPMAIVAEAAVARVKADTGCAEAALGKIRDADDTTEGGVRVRRGVVKVRGCGDIWNYTTVCRDTACTAQNADGPTAPAAGDDPLAVPDLGTLDLKDVDAAGDPD
jgi:hypothetical protein